MMELTARQNFELIQDRVKEARKRRAAAIHCQQVLDEGEQGRREDMKRFEREQRQHVRKSSVTMKRGSLRVRNTERRTWNGTDAIVGRTRNTITRSKRLRPRRDCCRPHSSYGEDIDSEDAAICEFGRTMRLCAANPIVRRELLVRTAYPAI